MWRKHSILITCITLISLIWTQLISQVVHASGQVTSMVAWDANRDNQGFKPQTAQLLPSIYPSVLLMAMQSQGVPPMPTPQKPGTPSRTPTHTSSPTATRTATRTFTRTRTPLRTNTPTITVPSIAQSINNTSFESGAWGWSEQSLRRSVIVQRVPPMARTGSWLAILGDYASENMSLSQRIYVPRSKSTLTFYYKVTSNEACGKFFDTARVYVGTKELWKLDACRYQVSSKWQLASINLKSYAGQYVNLRFNMITSSTNHSAWFIDDIGWR